MAAFFCIARHTVSLVFFQNSAESEENYPNEKRLAYSVAKKVKIVVEKYFS
jgi:hypothetical protein